MTDQYDSLMPRDLIITLRSLPRRFTTVYNAATQTSQLVSLVGQPSPEGPSLQHLVNEAARVVSGAQPAVASILTTDSPDIVVYEPQTVDRDDPMTVKDATASISDGALAVADQLDSISADDWTREATVAGGESTTLIDVVRRCVRSSIEMLRAAERQVEWMRAQPRTS